MTSINERKATGIDLVGRRMKYEPWTVDGAGAYRPPSETERRLTYGASGEAVAETLISFEASGGNCGQLVSLLNEHVPDKTYFVDRETLLDESRWYTNEYYFYFVMFTKKIMGDYNWCFTKGPGVRLSPYHKLYEQGHLRLLPYGASVRDSSNGIPMAYIKAYSALGFDFDDLYAWVDAITAHKTSIHYKNDVSKLDNYAICTEFLSYMYSFVQIVTNIASLEVLTRNSFSTSYWGGWFYVPESMCLKLVSFFFKNATNYFDVDIRAPQKNALDFTLTLSQTAYERTHVYNHSHTLMAHTVASVVLQEIVQRIYSLAEPPVVERSEGLGEHTFRYSLKWKLERKKMNWLELVLLNGTAVALSVLASFGSWGIAFFLTAFLVSTNGFFLAWKKSQFEKSLRLRGEERILRISEENNKRLVKSEYLASALMVEKEVLETKVSDRTAELIAANDKLKDVDVAKTNFFANISHELRTPLTLILGPLESILSGKHGQTISSQDIKLQMVQRNADKLLGLINNLLDFTKLEAGKMSPVPTWVDVSEALGVWTSTIKTYAEGRGLAFVFNDTTRLGAHPEARVKTWIDVDFLERVMFNLISNALKFTPSGGYVLIELRRDSSWFEISIKDSGIGIPQDQWASIFDRFVQVDSSTSRRYEGTGIGLSLCKELVEVMGGTISVTSTVGEGSIFVVRLPIVDADSNAKGQRPNEPAVSSLYFDALDATEAPSIVNVPERRSDARAHVLIVEDSRDMQNYLTSILEERYELTVTSNGKQALEAIEDRRPSLVLTDIMMPDVDGLAMTKRIKSDPRFRDIPVVMLTAKADLFRKLEGFEVGADDYIVKPFEAKELLARIKTHLRIKELFDTTAKAKDVIERQKTDLERVVEGNRETIELLNKSETRFREMVDELPIAMLELSKDLSITFFNRYASEFFTSELESDLKSTSLRDWLSPESFESLRSGAKSLGPEKKTTLLELEWAEAEASSSKLVAQLTAIGSPNDRAFYQLMLLDLPNKLNVAILPGEDFFQRFRLSQRESEVYTLVLRGFSNRDICERLFISESTVKKHLTNIFNKTNTNSRREIVQLVQG